MAHNLHANMRCKQPIIFHLASHLIDGFSVAYSFGASTPKFLRTVLYFSRFISRVTIRNGAYPQRAASLWQIPLDPASLLSLLCLVIYT